MSEAIQTSIELSPKAKAFYGKLKIYADRSGLVNGKTHENLGVTRNILPKLVKELTDHNLIEIVPLRGKNGTSVYKLKEYCD